MKLRALLALIALIIPRLAFSDDPRSQLQELRQAFEAPGDDAKPGVYWFFLDANLSKEGMRADLEAMKNAGLARAIAMEADLGGAKGNVDYMTDAWLECWRDACKTAEKLGIELTASVGPGWCGAGGPWIDPEHSMQHLRASETRVQGGRTIDLQLPIPEPRDPYFGRGSLGPCEKDWREFYRDVAVLAYPTPKGSEKLPEWEEKALFFRPPYSSVPNVRPYLVPSTDSAEIVASLADSVVPYDSILDLSDKLGDDGRLRWNAPEGNWTILRLGRRLTGQTTRPAPRAGLGLESDKFEKSGIELHFENFDAKLFEIGKFTTLHHDSWEMSSQNWSAHFRELFQEKTGYDPLKWTPVYFGVPVESVELSERFLWDVRRVAQELVYENNVLRMKELAAEKGLNFSSEVYDLNPAGDLYLFRAADIPMCEFWAKGYGFDSSFSVFEAVSSARTTGKPIVASESFTTGGDQWRHHPGISKRQGDWAFCAGVNRFYFHRMCSQPNADAPGLSLGPHGTHFDRTQTWFPLVSDYARFLSRAQGALQRGRTSTDVLFLDQEQAPSVFEAPSSMFMPGEFKDKKYYDFNGVCPQNLIEDARAENGKIVFPSGATYSLLVLPKTNEMTPKLAEKLLELADAGVSILGLPPKRSPSLVDYPDGDAKLRELVEKLWNGPNAIKKVPYPIATTAETFAPIRAAKWIWRDDAWNDAAPNVKQVFTKTIELPTDLSAAEFQARFADATLFATADNDFRVFVNGARALEGDNFHVVERADVAKLVKPGANKLRVEIVNGGDAPNPAAFIAAIALGDRIEVSDASWRAEESDGFQARQAFEIGPYDVSPWFLKLDVPFDRDSTYPTADVIWDELNRLNVVPDFNSIELLDDGFSEDSVRWIHKIYGEIDFYYLGARLDRDLNDPVCEFRVDPEKVAQLWDPITGKMFTPKRLPDLNHDATLGVRLVVPFRRSQSWFVVFAPKDAFAQQNLEDAPAPEYDRANASDDDTLIDLSNDWNVSFNQNASANRDFEQGRPKTLRFDALIDWTRSDDPTVRYYSGLAVYEKTFDFDGLDKLRADDRVLLKFSDVNVAARVELNGVELGTLWFQPWEIDVPIDALKANDNRLKITVANLWRNRLIGDAALPEQERFTRTSYPIRNPDEPLSPSGLGESLKLVRRPTRR